MDQVRTPRTVASGNGSPDHDGVDELSSTLRTERIVNALAIAVFGNPMDSEDHGIVGDVREIRHTVTDKLEKIFVAVLGLAGTLIVVAATLALALH